MNYRQKKKIAEQTPDLFNIPLTFYGDERKAFIELWNSKMWLPKLTPTDRQCKVIRLALDRPFFKTHGREAIGILAKCSFLVFKKRPKLDLDWFCDHDNFDKIMEGKYIDEKHQQEPDQKSIRTGDDEELL